MQRFVRKRRIVGGRIEIFIVCHTCREEILIETLTHEDVKMRRKFTRARDRKIRRGA